MSVRISVSTVTNPLRRPTLPGSPLPSLRHGALLVLPSSLDEIAVLIADGAKRFSQLFLNISFRHSYETLFSTEISSRTE